MEFSLPGGTDTVCYRAQERQSLGKPDFFFTQQTPQGWAQVSLGSETKIGCLTFPPQALCIVMAPKILVYQFGEKQGWSASGFPESSLLDTQVLRDAICPCDGLPRLHTYTQMLWVMHVKPCTLELHAPPRQMQVVWVWEFHSVPLD